MGLMSWLMSPIAPSATALELAGPPQPPTVTRRGYEFGISDQGLHEWSPSVQSRDTDRRTLMGELYDAYLVCPWSWAAVNAIARRITAGGLEFVWDPAEQTDRDQEQPKKPAEVVACERLFAFVNEREKIRQLLRGIITDLEVFGDAFVEVVWIGKIPVALFSLDCPSTTPIADKHGQITGYKQITEFGQIAEFEPREVIHISLDSPRSGVLGISPTQAALLPINIWLFAAATQLQTYRRGDPLTLHVDLPAEMSGPDIRRWVAQHMSRNVGPQNIGYPIVTKGGGSINELGGGAKASLASDMKEKRDEILAAYGVPPAKAGVIESGNLGGGTDEGQDKTFDVQTCDPLAELILEALFFHIAQRGFGVEGWKLQFAEVDTRDSKTIEDIRETRFKNGAYTLNEWRAEIGKPAVDGGDQALVLIAAGSVMRVRDIEAATLASMAKEVHGSGWEIADQGDKDAPIVLIKSEPKPVPAPLTPGAAGDPEDPDGNIPASDDEDPDDPDDPPGTDAEAPEESLQERRDGLTGGVVMLLPDAATAAALHADGGYDVDELHLTLAYLGDDVTSWSTDDRASLIAGARAVATSFDPLTGSVLGKSTFGEHTVYLIGDAPGLDDWVRCVRAAVAGREGVPTQREPFVAHVTAGKGLDVDDLPGTGPLRFDRLAVALAADWTEIRLDGAAALEATGGTRPRPKGRRWPGWERDQLLAGHYSDDLIAVVGAAFDPVQVAADWLARTAVPLEYVSPPAGPVALPVVANAAAIATAAAWLAQQDLGVQIAVNALLTELLIEAFLLGVKAARAVIAYRRRQVDVAAGGPPVIDPPDDTDTPTGGDDEEDDGDGFSWKIDWDSWVPGDPDAARKILGADGLGEGLADMLAASKVALDGIVSQRMAEFARVLAQAVADGDSPDTLARKLLAFQRDRVWARRTAITEVARAVSAATLDQYRDNGIERHEWLISPTSPEVKVCKLCQANAAAGEVKLGEQFPSGAVHPPQHPNCRCALIPVIDIPDADPDEAHLWAALAVAEAAGGTSDLEESALRDYWLTGKGLARWSTWTQLFNHIRKHVPDEKAKRIAASWYHARFGRWPGDKGKKGKGV